jgi:glutaminyl-peptide cyclotransferase
MKRILPILATVAILAAAAIWFLFFRGDGKLRVYKAEVVATRPHDSEAFTEGLFFRDGMLYESTGEVGTSGFRKVKPETGEIVQQSELPPPYFGEGIIAWKDRLYQVTWQDKAGFIYNLKDFSQRGTFSYTGEGWGLTHDDKSLILSDGTPTLRFLDPETLKVTRTLDVTADGCPLKNLNELEWIDGEIWANVWQTNLIARIDPASGKVRSFVDLTGLGPYQSDQDDVANGIAWDAAGKRLFVTGKHWPQLYEIKPGAETPATAESATLATCSR